MDDDRYATLDLTEQADPVRNHPDRLIESAWFLTDLDVATERRITSIVDSAAS